MAAALILGQILFAAVAAFVRTGRKPAGGESGLEALGLAALALGLAALCGGLVLRGFLRVPEGATGRARALAVVRRALVPIAVLEGGAIFNLLAWMLLPAASGNLLLAGLLVAVQVVLFPRAPAFAAGDPAGGP